MHYWPFARENSIWNATVTALQFCMADLEPHILSNALEWVYTAFFYSNSAQWLWNLPEEILFSLFVMTLNDTFERELAQGYESGGKSLRIPTPLRRPPQICHVSIRENLSFNPTTPLTTAEEHQEHSPQRLRSHSTVCCHLVFTSSDKESPVRTSDLGLWHPSTPDSSPLHGRAEPPSPVQHHMNYHHTSTPSTGDSFQDATVEEEDFPTAPLDDTIWLEDPVPHRHLCIHKQSQLHYQCSYPCPYRLELPHSSPEDAPAPYYELMDLSDISDLLDVMTTTSDEDIPDLKDIFRLWIQTTVCIHIYTPWTLSKWTNAELYKTKCTQHDGIHL